MGAPSSHFRCRSLHVKHPVRTLLGLLAGAAPAALAGVPSDTGLSLMVCELVGDFFELVFFIALGFAICLLLLSSTLVCGGVNRLTP